MARICLVTGATGFVGSHLVEVARAKGWGVRALVRPQSASSFLDDMGVDKVLGDLTDLETVRRAIQGVQVVFHCAAKVGDWGPIQEFRDVNVEGLRKLLNACMDRPVHRFIHFSSLGVYAARHHRQTDEQEPLPREHIDGYTQSKVEAEKLALEYYKVNKVSIVVLRPGFIYGPRDRTVLPTLVEKLSQRKVRYIGSNKRAMNTIFVGNLVDAAFLAVDCDAAVGQVFNLTDGEKVTKRRFIEAICEGVGVPKPPPVPVPLFLARFLAGWMETRARKKNSPMPPRLTQARLKFLGLDLDFSIEKARRVLGYNPKVGFEEGMKQTIAWFRDNR